MWDAYGRICKRLGHDRSDDLIEHVRQQIEEHGDAADRADLAAADAELADRRGRKGGRPRTRNAPGETSPVTGHR